MYTWNEDIVFNERRHQELLHRSHQRRHNFEIVSQNVNPVYRSLLARFGKQLMTWGYKLQKNSGSAVEFPMPASTSSS